MTKAIQKQYVAHQGAPFRLGGEIYILAPLAMAAYEQALADSRRASSSEDEKDLINYSVRVVHASLIRNYPEITFEQVCDLLDNWSMAQAVGIIMGKTGLPCEPTDEVPTLEKYRELTAAASE